MKWYWKIVMVSLFTLVEFYPWLGYAATVELSHRGRAEVVVSRHHMNQIYVADDRIVEVRGTPATYQLALTPRDGEAYVVLERDNKVTLFITTEKKQHYVLDLVPRGTLSAQVVAIQPEVPTATLKPLSVNAMQPKDNAVMQLMKRLRHTKITFKKRYRLYATHHQSPLRQSAMITKTVVLQLSQPGLVGTVYDIKNHSRHLITIPGDFWKTTKVAAFEMLQQVVPAKGQTRYYEVKYA